MRKKIYYNEPAKIECYPDTTDWVSELECIVCYMQFMAILSKKDKKIVNLLLKKTPIQRISHVIGKSYYYTLHRIKYLKAIFKLNMGI